MARVRIPINPLQVGKVGAYSMYVRKGEQIVRQRKNSSNYGPEASRTTLQQDRRARWGNIVNVFKALKLWQPRAWETAVNGRTDYNEFVSKNINSSRIYLTKDMCANGCAVMDAYAVSQGSLPPIKTEWSSVDNFFDTNIKLSESPLGKTVGFVSEDIITNNPGQFQDGDNIALIFFAQYLDGRNYPYLISEYFEITLDTTSSALLSDNAVYDQISVENTGSLALVPPQSEDYTDVGFVAIHTRKNGSLKVSTQKVVMCSTAITEQFNTQAARDAAIASYGQDETVPLDPSFSEATSVKVTYRGSQIWQSDQLRAVLLGQEGGELVVSGKGLSSKTIRARFMEDGSSNFVEYTPLFVDSEGWHYLLSSKGVFDLFVNDFAVVYIATSAIIIPPELPANLNMQQRTTTTVTSEGVRINNRTIIANCINYKFLKNNDYPYFYFRAGDNMPFDNFVVHNATVSNHDIDNNGRVRMSMLVTDASKAAYITYKEIVVAVFNYE